MGGGYETAAAETKTPFQRANEVFNDARALSAQIQILAEKLVGPIPEDAGKSDRAIGGGGVLGVLEFEAEAVRQALGAGFGAVQRIQRRLP